MSARSPSLNKNPRKFVISTAVAILLSWGSATPARAQGASEFQNVRRSVATVIFSGLGGAVLGLSTLSFYGKPEDHTGNIYAGLGVGLLAGLIYVSMDPEASMASISAGRPKLALADFNPMPKSAGPPWAAPLATYSWSF